MMNVHFMAKDFAPAEQIEPGFRVDATLVLVAHPSHVDRVKALGHKHCAAIDLKVGGEQALRDGVIKTEWSFERFAIALPKQLGRLREDLAARLGDERCGWFDWDNKLTDDELSKLIARPVPMWTDEVATMADIPEPGPEATYRSGFEALDRHGFRITLPAFMPIIGPYGSGKSVFLRQLLINLYKLHGWKFLLTSFEEKVKPRYQRDLRRHFLGRPLVDAQGRPTYTEEELREVDDEIAASAVFLRRKRNATLDLERLLNRIEYAVRAHGVRVVAIDPVNEIEHQIGKGESKTDYMGRFIMALKQLADDYGLLMIVCAHPPKDGVEKRLSKTGLLTLNDGADTAHWGNKADIGFCVWRNIDSPTLLHADKLKDHETMGKPFLAEMRLDAVMNQFHITRMGFDILGDDIE